MAYQEIRPGVVQWVEDDPVELSTAPSVSRWEDLVRLQFPEFYHAFNNLLPSACEQIDRKTPRFACKITKLDGAPSDEYLIGECWMQATHCEEACPERIAFYRPWHFDSVDWGIYYNAPALIALAHRYLFFGKTNGSSVPEDAKAARVIVFELLRAHELFHFHFEQSATRREVESNRPLYVNYTRNVYQKAWPGQDCVEESLANKAMVCSSSPCTIAYAEKFADSGPGAYGRWREPENELLKKLRLQLSGIWPPQAARVHNAASLTKGTPQELPCDALDKIGTERLGFSCPEYMVFGDYKDLDLFFHAPQQL